MFDVVKTVLARGGLVAACVFLVAGCMVKDNAIEFHTGEIGRAYVPGQIISAMQNAGYSQVEFKSFKTNDMVKREFRENEKTEMRFLRRGKPTYIAVVDYDIGTTRVFVSLSEDGHERLSEKGQSELELVRASLRETFGPRIVQ